MSVLESVGIGLVTNLLYETAKKIKLPKRKSETQKISDRLNFILKLMNDQRDEKFTIAEFSRILKLKKVSELEKYFLNQDEPTFKFLKKFSKEFGINLEWLTEGKNYPFLYDREIYIHLFEDCLNKIEELKPQVIYFIRANSLDGKTCIMLEISNHKLVVLNTYVHFSGKNGHGGTLNLVDLRKLIMTLILERRYLTKGVIVSNKIFNDLRKGKIFPYSSLRLKQGRFDYWHDDFTDIYNQRCGFQRHSNYDKNFKDAFNIVKNYIEENS